MIVCISKIPASMVHRSCSAKGTSGQLVASFTRDSTCQNLAEVPPRRCGNFQLPNSVQNSQQGKAMLAHHERGRAGHATTFTSTAPSSLAQRAEGKHTLESKAWGQPAPGVSRSPGQTTQQEQQGVQRPPQKVTQVVTTREATRKMQVRTR